MKVIPEYIVSAPVFSMFVLWVFIITITWSI